jgi:hypothetical protein
LATAPPPARPRFNPRGRPAALPPSYTTTWDTTEVRFMPSSIGLAGWCMEVGFSCRMRQTPARMSGRIGPVLKTRVVPYELFHMTDFADHPQTARAALQST